MLEVIAVTFLICWVLMVVLMTPLNPWVHILLVLAITIVILNQLGLTNDSSFRRTH